MKKLAFAGALALAVAVVVSIAACSSDQQTSFNDKLVTTTKNVAALNTALVQVNATLIDNAVAQAKLLAPYTCGAYKLASAIVAGSSAEATVNAYLKKNVAAGIANVAVKDICAALGQSTDVSTTTTTTTTSGS